MAAQVTAILSQATGTDSTASTAPRTPQEYSSITTGQCIRSSSRMNEKCEMPCWCMLAGLFLFEQSFIVFSDYYQYNENNKNY
ncbi:hypothetical protein [Paenibacillus sp. FSL R10-2748]|uniref:hypothetical protein n=1 Tax=Paenibacillus sp. FSL R10-2748 TaxID=2954658 RepID=UPI0030FBF41A